EKRDPKRSPAHRRRRGHGAKYQRTVFSGIALFTSRLDLMPACIRAHSGRTRACCAPCAVLRKTRRPFVQAVLRHLSTASASPIEASSRGGLGRFECSRRRHLPYRQRFDAREPGLDVADSRLWARALVLPRADRAVGEIEWTHIHAVPLPVHYDVCRSIYTT